MAVNRGKEFEHCVSREFGKTFPEGTIDRIYDTEGFKKGIKNVCDFIGYTYPYIMYIEAKSCTKNTFNLKKLTQYDKLLEKKNKKGVLAGVLVWFIDHKKVVFAKIELVEELINRGVKSINARIPETYTIELDTITKRIYPEINFEKLLNIVN